VTGGIPVTAATRSASSAATPGYSGGAVVPVAGWRGALGASARFVVVLAIMLGQLLAAVPALLVATAGRRERPAEVMRRRARVLLTRLGPSYIKGAQLLSTRRDIVPVRWCDELAQLHDQVPPLPAAVVRQVLRSAYPAGEIALDSVRWDAVASGSIACVYPALADGRQVAVKVRRPGVAARIHYDFTIISGVARVLQWLPPLRRLPMVTIVGQLRAAVARQADFGLEVQALQALNANLADLDYVQVPLPLPELCRSDVIVMEYVAGLRAIEAGEPASKAADRILHCVYRMLFLDGLVHCDMHPGNLYVLPDDRLVLLDAGFVVRLGPRVRSLFAEFFLYMIRGDGTRCADIVRRSAAEVPGDADLEAFRAGMTDLIDDTSSRRYAGDFSLVRFATRLFDLQRRHGLFAAPEFIFPLLALMVLEGRIKQLHARADFQAAALPVLLKALRAGHVLG
jgi:ubiquinone biosynthesis protein